MYIGLIVCRARVSVCRTRIVHANESVREFLVCIGSVVSGHRALVGTYRAHLCVSRALLG